MEKVLKKDNSIEIKVGASESMSKSKKNIIDPEEIIKNFGADSVRLFILSDSPQKKMYSGQKKVLCLLISLSKNYGLFI